MDSSSVQGREYRGEPVGLGSQIPLPGQQSCCSEDALKRRRVNRSPASCACFQCSDMVAGRTLRSAAILAPLTAVIPSLLAKSRVRSIVRLAPLFRTDPSKACRKWLGEKYDSGFFLTRCKYHPAPAPSGVSAGNSIRCSGRLTGGCVRHLWRSLVAISVKPRRGAEWLRL
jgi:hypothetical protein